MRRKIIYLDDEPACLRLFADTFNAEFEVCLAQTPREARALLCLGAPDVFISDQSLGELSGTEFLTEVATLCPSSYRVLLTGTISLGSVLVELGTGVVEAFISKPWTEESVRLMLARADARRLLNDMEAPCVA